MNKRIFEDREHAMEENYFRQQDARLIENLRQYKHLHEIAGALGEKLQVENPALLVKASELGITSETAPAVFLAPLVQVAWAEGSVGEAEREAVLRIARRRDLDEKSPAYAQLVEWLRTKPPQAIFDLAIQVLKIGFSVLPRVEREERIDRIVDACREVALTSGKGLAPLLGLGSTVSPTETGMVERIDAELRKPVKRTSPEA